MPSSVLDQPRLHVRAILEAIEEGSLTPADALSEAQARIASENDRVKAFVHLPDAPIQARAGPLAGISVGVKDIIDTADMPTEMGSSLYRGNRPRFDAALVAMAREAGASIVGKTATTEFASLDPTETINPAAPSRTPGGSSSGSAAGVSAGLCAAAFGTQTAGSVIRPAAFCGVAGYKPSFRLLPTVGFKTFAWTLDTGGLFAATIDDVGLFADRLTGRPLTPSKPIELTGVRLGFYRTGIDQQVEPAMAAAIERVREILERAGAEILDIEEPAALSEGRECHAAIIGYEGARALMAERLSGKIEGPRLAAILEEGAAISSEEYDSARRGARIARKAANSLFETVDALVLPSAFGAAPEGLAATGDPAMAKLWTLTGNPVVNVPGMMTDEGAPLGISVVARFGRDRQLLEVASAIEPLLVRD